MVERQKISTKRIGTTFDISIKDDNIGLFNISMNAVQKEHMLLFDNKTVFSDILLDLATGFRQERLKIGYNYSNFIKFITDQGINVVFAVIGLFDQVRNYNKKNIKNYIEIYIQTDIKNIIKFSKKKHYINNNKFIWGIDLKPEFPKKPDILINNDFKKSSNELAKIILKQLKTIKKKFI